MVSSSHIRTFLIGDATYHHRLYNDRVECTHGTDLVLTYTADNKVLDKTGKVIGHWQLDRFRTWRFYGESGISIIFREDLLRAEVELSKMYIQGEL